MNKKGKYCLLILSIFYCFIFCFYSLAQAQETLAVKEVNIIKLDSKYRVFVTSTGPTKYTVREYFKPRSLVIDIPGAELTFMNKKFMTIPVDTGGIKNIEARQVYTRDAPSQKVEIIILFYEDITYDIISQWQGQYITVDIRSIGPLPKQERSYLPSEKDRAMTIAMEEARKKSHGQRSLTDIEKIRSEKLANKKEKELEAARKKMLKDEKYKQDMEQARKTLTERAKEEKTPIAKRELLESIQAKDTFIIPGPKRAVPKKKISELDECVEIALLNHRPAQIAQEQLKLAQLRVKEAKRAFYPSLLGEWKETQGRTITEQYVGRTFGLQMQQPVYTGGKLQAMLNKEALGEKIALGNFDRIRQDLIYKVSAAYYDVVRLKRTYGELKRLVDESRQYLELTEKQFRFEASTVTELLNVQSAYNQIHFQLVSTQKDLEIAKLALQKEMNIENADFSGIGYHLEFKKVNVKLDDCIDLAYRNRPEPRTLEYMVSSAEYGKKAIDSEKKPNFSLLGTYGKAGESFKSQTLDMGTQWSIMGKVNWFFGGHTLETSLNREESNPTAITTYTGNKTENTAFNTKFAFWDNLAHFSKLQEAEITKKQAEHEKEQMMQTIRSDVEEAFYNYQKAKAQASAAANEVGYRSKEIEVVKSKKEINEATFAEVLEAIIKLSEAKASYIQAMASSEIAVAGLNRAIGVIGYFK